MDPTADGYETCALEVDDGLACDGRDQCDQYQTWHTKPRQSHHADVSKEIDEISATCPCHRCVRRVRRVSADRSPLCGSDQTAVSSASPP